MAKKNLLPHKPSDLIGLALDDLNRAERSKLYEIDMEVWHRTNSHCTVCLAGSVMAFELGANPKHHCLPGEYDDNTANKLGALNSFRVGSCSNGFERMGRSYKIGMKFDRYVPNYEQGNARGFKLAMRRMVRDLREAGY